MINPLHTMPYLLMLCMPASLLMYGTQFRHLRTHADEISKLSRKVLRENPHLLRRFLSILMGLGTVFVTGLIGCALLALNMAPETVAPLALKWGLVCAGLWVVMVYLTIVLLE